MISKYGVNAFMRYVTNKESEREREGKKESEKEREREREREREDISPTSPLSENDMSEFSE
jgi:predicted nucleotidyltransferase